VIAYTSWKLFGDEPVATFNWDHSYGPLDWPQEGTELFEVRSDAPLYWKTTVLDEFDGTAWGRADTDYADSGTDYELAGASAELISENPRWIREFEVTVGPLESDLAVVAGSAPGVTGLDLDSASGDGTTLLAEALAEGSTYGVRAYAPNPTARKLRRGPQSYPPGLERYTTLLLPSAVAGPTVPVDPLAYATVPPSGAKETPAERSRGLLLSPIDGAVEGSSYERVLRLARRVTRGAETDHEAVARIERYLLDNYEYEQEVPDRREPLPDFLFRDRIGYCQQFSGSMVLMLRMLGIPSRVAAGFAPGQADAEQGTYVVRDTDAHSWVEVFFPEVGWVTVDPTPSAAPARTGTTGSADGAASTSVSGLGRAFSLEESADPGGSADLRSSRPARAEESSGSPVPFLVFTGAFLAFGGVRHRRRRRLLSPAGAALQVRELEDALHAAGRASARGTTLLQIERILGDIAGPRAARYAASLRENRYSADRPRRPGPDARRELRSALARGRGPVGWLRALRAIPPGGPRA
jgi:transglutaminase-like putative cysteine protease